MRKGERGKYLRAGTRGGEIQREAERERARQTDDPGSQGQRRRQKKGNIKYAVAQITTPKERLERERDSLPLLFKLPPEKQLRSCLYLVHSKATRPPTLH